MNDRIRSLLAQSLLELGTRLEVPLASLVPGQDQPRRRFSSLDELAESIRRHGLLQPLLVHPPKDGKYRIICGERRFLAARLAGLETIPVRVLEVSDQEARTLALMENLQREDLNPYEETIGVLELLALRLGLDREETVRVLYKMLNEKKKKSTQNVLGNFEPKVTEVFRVLGRFGWESFVQTRLPLLRLGEDIRQALEQGRIPYTFALVLNRVKDSHLRRELLQAVAQGLSLRELKAKVQEHLRRTSGPPPFYRQALSRLAKVRLETLAPARQRAVERKLKELLRLLEGS